MEDRLLLVPLLPPPSDEITGTRFEAWFVSGGAGDETPGLKLIEHAYHQLTPGPRIFCVVGV